MRRVATPRELSSRLANGGRSERRLYDENCSQRDLR
jgi:hypothetical protein